MNINISELMDQSGVHFGTSGVRGLVSDMTDKVCYTYVLAFLQHMQQQQQISVGERVGIAGDLRKSSPRIISAAVAACQKMGLIPVYCGLIPTPAVALYGFHQRMPTIMVTGSHIPDDRNGIKFNTPTGEILKHDEVNIRQQTVAIDDSLFDDSGYFLSAPDMPAVNDDASQLYVERYLNFFPANCLQHKRIGLYQHSSVARDLFKRILEGLGAKVTALGRSDAFISVDTEAIRPEDIEAGRCWYEQYHFDCIVSTDGDGDRPLISNEKGQWLRGDIAGILCADYLDAEVVVTPVSSNSAVEKSQLFSQVTRTKIGSPFVISAMQEAAQQPQPISVVGYEANGGFLQQTPLSKADKTLAPLPTRDAIIVALSVMMSAFSRKLTIAELVETLPARYTYSDRLKNFPTQLSQTILGEFLTGDWQKDSEQIQKALPGMAAPVSIDDTDGVRITLENADVVHIRPSGNAPELRCYTESTSEQAAQQLNQVCMQQMTAWR